MLSTRMRRALASLLLATLSFPLIGGLIFANAESSLPECCRRAGLHHCAMPAQADSPAGPAVNAPATCASWPKSEAPLTNFQNAVPTPVLYFQAEVPAASQVSQPADRSLLARPTDSVRKRGPPSLVS
jgi:hypothetical protein